MKNIELQKYLNRFRKNDDISFIICNPDKSTREIYPCKAINLMTGMDMPVFVIEVEEALNLDNENLKHTDLSDQMELKLN